MVDSLVDGELLLAVESLSKRLALDVRHHIIKQALYLTRIEERQDVRMIETGRHSDFAKEPVGAERSGQLRVQHLERHHALVLRILGQIDSCHSAASELTIDRVGRREDFADALD